MKKTFLLFFVAANVIACAQKTDDAINAKEVQRIETVLASDDMRGRRAGTPDIDNAANFIADEFKKAGLQPYQANGFLQQFTMLRPKMTSLKFERNGVDADTKNVVVITGEPDLKVNEKSGYEIQTIGAAENFLGKAQSIVRSNKNSVVFVDTSWSQNFSRLMIFKRQRWL